MEKKKLVRNIIFILVIIGAILILSEKVSNAAEIPDGIYTIKSAKNEGYAVDITAYSKNDCANVEIWNNNGGLNQKFLFTHVGNNYYTVKAVYSNKYLDIAWASTANGANVEQYTYNGNSNQMWLVKKTDDGYYNLISKCGGKYLDIANGVMSPGTNVLMWEYNGGINQKFKLESCVESAPENGTYTITTTLNSRYAVDIEGNSKNNCANALLWSQNGANNQKFDIKSVGQGAFTICSSSSSKYLDVEGASKKDGANILQYAYNGGLNQHWYIISDGRGNYYIVSRWSGLCMDVAGGKAGDGSNILTWSYNGGNNQKFKITPTTKNIEDTGRSAEFKKQHPDIKIGIDVSKYQGTIDWNAVKRDGIDYVMIRAGFRGYGSNGSLNEDPKLDEYARGARAAGLDVGIYFFSQATNYQEGVEEANYTIGLIKKYDITYPVAFDTEDSSSPDNTGRADGIDVQARTDAAKGFCSTIKKSGYKTLIYASPSWIKENLDIKQLSEYDVWLANYTGATQEDPLKKPTNYKGKYVMWQYTDAGTVNGIKGKVDCDLFYYLK